MSVHSGGWHIKPAVNNAVAELSDEQKAFFEQAFSGLDGAHYQPLVYLGSQVVNGVRYAYIAKTHPVIPDGDKQSTIVSVIFNPQQERSSANPLIKNIFE